MPDEAIRFRTKNLHLNSGEIVPAVTACIPGQALEILPFEASADIVLADNAHTALARCDPHVHARESVMPTREEFEKQKIHETDYMQTVNAILDANQHYNACMASLAALKGGVWMIGCMGNTPWGPIGPQRWEETLAHYQKNSHVRVHVWPRMEPGVEPIPDQEGKDFGSTFGGSGLSPKDRDDMYSLYRGCDVSFHNDGPRPNETIDQFFRRCSDPLVQKHHLYFDWKTVLASQRETIALAREHGLRSLRARHVPTGSAFEMLLQERKIGNLELPIEVGLDYMYWNYHMVLNHPTGMINYRRPAFPSMNEQISLIELVKKNADDETIHFGSDHAPHSKAAKDFKNGLPGSPGTRILEHSHQIHMSLVHQHEFSHQQIDNLAAIHPALYMQRYCVEEFPFPIAKMESGAMANLVVFDPDCSYTVDEQALSNQLDDVEYHSPLRTEKLKGKVLFTVVNGRVWDVAGGINRLN